MSHQILYDDHEILVVRKPAGVPTQPDLSGQADLLTSLHAAYPTAHLVHRLDTPTGGVMVFGLTPAATASLSALLQEHSIFVKEYLAVVAAPPAHPEGEWHDWLYHDKRQNKTYVVDAGRKGVKKAVLTYRTVQTREDGHSLLAVRLHTGRTHQIRAQMAARGLPLVGDGKYGSREKCRFIGLWAYRLTFPHPATRKTISIEAWPDTAEAPWSYFGDIDYMKKTE